MRLTFALLALFATTAAAQPPKPACQGPEYRQFDFWAGEWNVFDPTGKQVGQSRIEIINNGCSILENWNGGGGGKSLNSYDAKDKQWHQYWVDSSGSRLVLDGSFANGQMVLASSGAQAQKITWTPNADGSVRQHWESSKDGGKTWITSFDGKYIKKESK